MKRQICILFVTTHKFLLCVRFYCENYCFLWCDGMQSGTSSPAFQALRPPPRVIRLMKKEAEFSEASVCFQQFRRQNVTEGRNLHCTRKYGCDALPFNLREEYEFRKLENKQFLKEFEAEKCMVNSKYDVRCNFIICTGYLMKCNKLNVAGWDGVNTLSVRTEGILYLSFRASQAVPLQRQKHMADRVTWHGAQNIRSEQNSCARSKVQAYWEVPCDT